jgi:hypothetical protein
MAYWRKSRGIPSEKRLYSRRLAVHLNVVYCLCAAVPTAARPAVARVYVIPVAANYKL